MSGKRSPWDDKTATTSSWNGKGSSWDDKTATTSSWKTLPSKEPSTTSPQIITPPKGPPSTWPARHLPTTTLRTTRKKKPDTQQILRNADDGQTSEKAV